MCTRYISPEAGDIERLWHVGGRTPMRWAREVFPIHDGTFVHYDVKRYPPKVRGASHCSPLFHARLRARK